MPHSQGLQYLRGIAAVGVVVFHAFSRTAPDLGFDVGAAGVDAFFVLSGFLMWAITCDNAGPGPFLRNRIRRIVPAYWVATSVIVLGGFAGIFPNLKLSVGHTAASYLFTPHVSPSSGETVPVLWAGWTLEYELFFYACFAAILFLPRRAQLFALTTGFLGLVVLGIVLHPEATAARFYTATIILEFLAGAWFGFLWTRGFQASPRTSLMLIAGSIIWFAMTDLADVHVDRTLMWGLPALALLVGTLGLDQAGRLPRWRFLAFLGDASYSIYLWHGVAIAVVLRVSDALSLPAPVAIPVEVVAGVAAGAIGYWLIERPFQRFLSRPRRASVPTP